MHIRTACSILFTAVLNFEAFAALSAIAYVTKKCPSQDVVDNGLEGYWAPQTDKKGVLELRSCRFVKRLSLSYRLVSCCWDMNSITKPWGVQLKKQVFKDWRFYVPLIPSRFNDAKMPSLKVPKRLKDPSLSFLVRNRGDLTVGYYRIAPVYRQAKREKRYIKKVVANIREIYMQKVFEENKKVVMEPRFVLTPGPQYEGQPLQIFRRPIPPKINPNAKNADFFARSTSGIAPAPPRAPKTVVSLVSETPPAILTPMILGVGGILKNRNSDFASLLRFIQFQ